MNAQVFLIVAVAVILLFKNAETPGAFLRHQVGGRAFEAGAGRLSPWTSCRNLPVRHPERDYTTFPPGHFDMVWASPVCTEYSRALNYLMLVYIHARRLVRRRKNYSSSANIDDVAA